ncbi:hypothetical protein BT63DRAFT_419976 [Microthyrium microscopicum]|uniref:SAP domain-containing protein n=1 Tax=Microthyrium microscopicum TaxID=703497 RepID=A0A6A6UR06_9PEZI|nr:hypothetical protein BT63DRAFT_419976 [Microthyrium microscopicum]
MADYNKMTVANLRVLLKDRGIPQTGLARKAQIVAKLEEVDAASNAAVEDPVDDGNTAEPEQAEEPPAPTQPAAPTELSPKPSPEPVPEPALSAPSPPPQKSPSPTIEAVAPPQVPESEPTETTSSVPPPTFQSQSSPSQSKAPSLNLSASQTPVPSKEAPSTQATSEAMLPPSTADTTMTSQVDTDVDERKKRKRRSGSPSVDTQDIALKKAKYLAEDVHLKEDDEAAKPKEEKNDISMPDAPKIEAGHDEPENLAKVEPQAPLKEGDVPVKRQSPAHERRPAKESRYQQLLPVEKGEQGSVPPTPIDDLPTPPPAIHHATRALYIRDLMRPLQPSALKNHLASLTGTSDDTSIETLHVDSIRSHAFVVVSTTNGAARIRAGMHNQIWPKERDRKQLWVDYIPEAKVQEWIDTETNSGGGSRLSNKKWEVEYRSRDGEMVAELVEAGSGAPSRPPPARPESRQWEVEDRRPSYSREDRQPSISRAPTAPKFPQPKEAEKSFVALDKLFKSTTAKPMLYFKPVDTDLADKRLDELDDLTARKWSDKDWREDEQHYRYSFEGDKLVSGGLHRAQGAQARLADGRNAGHRPPRFNNGPRGGGWRR